MKRFIRSRRRSRTLAKVSGALNLAPLTTPVRSRRRSRTLAKVWIPWLAAILLFPLGVLATQITSLKFKDITERSEVIFRGVCEKKVEETMIHPQSGKKIPVTVYFFSTKEILKGQVGSKIEVKQLAVRSAREAHRLGIFGPLNLVSFQPGKDYLLFLGEVSPLGIQPVIGGSLGKILIEKDSSGAETIRDEEKAATLSYGDFVKTVQKNLNE